MSSNGLFTKPLFPLALAVSLLTLLPPEAGSTAEPVRKSSTTQAREDAARASATPSRTVRRRATRASAPAKRTSAPLPAGLLIGRDPVTGGIGVPTHEQRRALLGESTPRDRSGYDLPVIRLADGTRIVHLDERYMDYWVARLDSTGKIRMGCVTGPEAARGFIAPAPGTPARRAVEQ